MSTLPHNSPDVTAEARAAMVAPIRCDFSALIQHFVATADALGAPRPSRAAVAWPFLLIDRCALMDPIEFICRRTIEV